MILIFLNPKRLDFLILHFKLTSLNDPIILSVYINKKLFFVLQKNYMQIFFLS